MFGDTTTTTTTSTTTTTTTSSTTTTTIPPVTASGTVTDAGGRVIAGVAVTFGEAGAVTDDAGRFEVSAPEGGPLELSKSGWETVHTEWERGEGPRHLTLEPAVIRGLRVGAGAVPRRVPEADRAGEPAGSPGPVGGGVPG